MQPLLASVFLLAILWQLPSDGMTANILILTPVGPRSQKIFFTGLAEPLAQAGHQVTIVSTHKSTLKKNIRDVVLSARDVTAHIGQIFDKTQQASLVRKVMFSSPDLCIQSLASQEMQDLKKEQFDLIILSMFFSPCYLSLVHHFRAPLILGHPMGLFGHYASMAGQVQMFSLQKSDFSAGATFPFSFYNRLKNILANVALTAFNEYYIFPRSEKLCREMDLCPPDMPSLQSISEDASLTIINRVKNLEFPPKPTLPNVIYAGGIHCHKPKPLPKDLEHWVSAAKEGFILFAMGSAFNMSQSMPKRYQKVLVKTFGSLKYKVLWKWEKGTIDHLPSNVRLEKWLPQQDLLGHKKIKLFISHGGLSSIIEATYHGVPIIGMPLVTDQYSNIGDAVSEGWAAKMDWDDLNEEAFKKRILEVIENPKFKNTAIMRSTLMRDAPRPPGEEVKFWVDHVLRRRGATDHLKSPVFKLHMYELYNLDVWAALLGIFAAIMLVIFSCIKFTINTLQTRAKLYQKEKDE